jgi:hypothetical protein
MKGPTRLTFIVLGLLFGAALAATAGLLSNSQRLFKRMVTI